MAVDKHPKGSIARIQPAPDQGKNTQMRGTMQMWIARTFLILVLTSMIGAEAMSKTPQEPQPFPSPKKEPPIVTPGKTDREPPSDAIVLFDGKDLSKWRSGKDGGEPKWLIKDGYTQVVPRTGDIASKEEFGDCLL